MSVHEIRVFPQGHDPNAEALRAQAASLLGLSVDAVTARVFYVEGVNDDEAARLATELFTDPVVETAEVEKRTDWDNNHRVEVSYQPGVTNPETGPIMEATGLLNVHPVATDSATEYHFASSAATTDIDRVTSGILVNETVQRVRTEAPETLVIGGQPGPVETIIITDLDEDELATLSKNRSLFLDPSELKTLQNYFKDIGREPTDCELELIAGRWSEHCGHKTFNAKIFKDGQEKDPLFKRIKDTARLFFDEDMISAFNDNSGVFYFYDGMAICIKLETHNSPSAAEPYGGAMTGSGGVFRDIMGTGRGAKNILSIDIFCTADPELPADQVPVGCLPPAHLLERITAGVRDYGNRFGNPTANGSIKHHPDFRGKLTVMVGALGMVPEQHARKGSAEFSDLAVTIGGRTGRDGIHGATFSSGSMTAETATVHSSAVQIGDSITQKKMADALLEARDAGCMRALTDCGAAGFSSAIGEMGEDIGVQVDISKAPLKYSGLAPWEIWMSESQERMIAAVIPEMYDEFAAICAKHEVEVAALGTFGTPGGEPKLLVTYGEEVVADLDYDFLKNGLAQRELVAAWQPPQIEEATPHSTDWETNIKAILAHGNVRSRESTVRQYDHEVQGATVVKPFSGVHRDAPNDGVVLTPILGKPYGLVEAHGMNPALNNINPYTGTKWAIAEALANYTAIGGNPDKSFWTNNFVTATPDEHVMGVLDLAVDAICDGMHAFQRPIISGKDSLSSRYEGKMPSGEDVVIDVPPVVTITVAGKIPDVAKTLTSDIKQPGSALVLVGKPDYEAMGGSVWYDVANGSSAKVPDVDLPQLAETLRGVHDAMQTDKVLACHDVSEGGIITTVAEMAFGGDCGVNLHLSADVLAEQQLFNETAGCLVVEVTDELAAQELFAGLPHRILGITTDDKIISATQHDQTLFTAELDDLKAAWKYQPQPQEHAA